MNARWEMTYLGMDTFIAECGCCPWSYTGSIAKAQNEIIRHVRGNHL